MSFLNPTDQELYNATTAAPGTSQLVADNWYDGLPKGVLQGVVGAAAGVGQLGLDIASSSPVNNSRAAAFGRMTTTNFNNFKNDPPAARSELSKTIQSTLDSMHEWAKVDPRVQGSGAQFASGLTRGLSLGAAGFATGGPVGAAALMGGTEADTAYHDAKAQGLDDSTAYQMATLAGVTNAAGAFLPMSAGGAGLKGLAQSMLAGSGINVAVGAANRFASSAILYENGYKDMAQQYQVTDATSIAADAILGAAFGALGHAGKPRFADPEQIHNATEVLKGEQIDRSGPGIPITPEAATAHTDTLTEAVSSLERGRMPQVDDATADTIARETLPDPVIKQTLREGTAALDAEDPGIRDFAKPVDVPEKPYTPVEPPAQPEAGQPVAVKPEAAAEPGAGSISPQASATLEALVKSHPDLEIQLEDGRTVKVADLPEMFQRQTAEASKLATLHDVAAACFMGTE